MSELRPRARDLGLPLSGNCGRYNAITDVPGVSVGQVTLIHGNGRLVLGQGPVRTGVTAILPRGRDCALQPVWAGFHALNGNGEMTGVHWIRDGGYFIGPVCLTNTHGVGAVHHGVLKWLRRAPGFDPDRHRWLMPVVSETCDAYLNDIHGLHVTPEHAGEALDRAAGGIVAEGNSGGGTGMICYEFKGGTGSASRLLRSAGQDYTVGVLVQANFGTRDQLNVCGVPVGQHLREHLLWPRQTDAVRGSIVVIIATDAPLLPHQLRLLARRATVGISRTGGYGENGSGDLFLAFSTAADPSPDGQIAVTARYLPQGQLNALYQGVAEAVEEAILNALIAAETLVGRDDHRVQALDQGALTRLLQRYGRLVAQ